LLEFLEAHKGVDLRIHFSDSRLDLIEEGLDVALRITSNLAETTIVRKLGSCDLTVVASPSYLAQQGEPTHPEQLQAHECLGYFLRGDSEPWLFEVDGRIKPFYFEHRLQANNGDALAEAAARGFGLAVVPDFIAETYLNDGRLVAILNGFAPPPIGIYGVLPSNRYMPHRVGVLLDFLATKLKPS